MAAMHTTPTPTTTATGAIILALDTGKYKSVACASPATGRRTLRASPTAAPRQACLHSATVSKHLLYPARFPSAEIVALVYHARSAAEQPELHEVVDRSVQTDPHRKEYREMGQTIAEMYIQQGELAMARSTLLRLLRKRFKKLPRKVRSCIAAPTNLRELETWLDNFASARTLADVGMPLD
jgi:hypothetical protein